MTTENEQTVIDQIPNNTEAVFKDFLLVFVLYHCNLNMFGLDLDQTEQQLGNVLWILETQIFFLL